jgi:hypothetical protein
MSIVAQHSAKEDSARFDSRFPPQFRVARWFVFKPKNPNLGKFWRALDWKILWLHGIFYGHLGYFITVWYILCSFGTFLSGFGIMYQEKSGNPASINEAVDNEIILRSDIAASYCQMNSQKLEPLG